MAFSETELNLTVAREIFSRSAMIVWIIAITTFSDTEMTFSNLARGVEVPLSTVDVYRLEGSVPDYPVSSPTGGAGRIFSRARR